MSTLNRRLGLEFNPFEPAASGAPLINDLWLPESWKQKFEQVLRPLSQGQGTKAFAISGEYGSGKTYILQWLYRHALPRRRIKPFYFDNPGVQFYDLANSLLRQVGRKDFAKYIWELAAPHVNEYQRSFFLRGFEEYLAARRNSRGKQTVPSDLQDAIQKSGITNDEEIAHRLALIVTDTPIKPYFDYRDFIAGQRQSLVAEGEEAPYFKALLKTLQLAGSVDAVAFLIDEFEEISLQKRLTRREAHDYLATLKRLINLTQSENLWLIVTMTPPAVQTTQMLEPALWERFTGQGQYQFEIPPLKAEEAVDLVKFRLDSARPEGSSQSNSLFPFPESFASAFRPATFSTPRTLIKVCFYAISEVGSRPVPFTLDYLRDIEKKLYPAESAE